MEGDVLQIGQDLTSECVVTTPSRSLVHSKKRFCRTIWIDFLCAYGSSYVFNQGHSRRHLDSGMYTLYMTLCVRKVVTRSLTRILSWYVTYRHMVEVLKWISQEVIRFHFLRVFLPVLYHVWNRKGKSNRNKEHSWGVDKVTNSESL